MPQEMLLHVNGTPRPVVVDMDRTLLSVLRDELDLTGTKYGCGEAQCGACTVLVDGLPTRACVTPVGTIAGAEILTIEGLERDGRLHPVQQAFLDEDAFQCGFCTPGMIMTATALLDRKPDPSVPEIVRAMNGNICRCCTYARIVSAVQSAAKARTVAGGAA